MELHFDQGDSRRPKGHALLYFRSGQNSAAILGTYLVVLPIPIELGKYIPPMLASRISGGDAASPAVVPLPPIPEQVESVAHLRHLAICRDDDLIYGGTISADDLPRSMQVIAEIAQRYLDLYNQSLQSLGTANPEEKPLSEGDLNVHEVMYSLMGEHDLLAELSKLTGQLRYAVDGADERVVAETVAEMERLAKYLPEKYRVGEFIAAARLPGDRGRRLAALFMDRCYKLYQEDYASLAKVEADLKAVQDSQ